MTSEELRTELADQLHPTAEVYLVQADGLRIKLHSVVREGKEIHLHPTITSVYDNKEQPPKEGTAEA